MSGIAGAYSFRFPNAEKLKQGLTYLVPPFANGEEFSEQVYQHNNIGIGVVGKNTPFVSNEEKTTFVAFAGSLIRKEKLLKELQVTPNKDISDAELILRVYSEKGIDFLKSVDGYFVFQILDLTKKVLYIVRDRVGHYPLFWTITSQAILFASSLKAILATGLVSPSPDLQSIAGYLFLGYISQDDTPIQDVNRLLPGYYIKLTFEGNLSIHQYWSFSSSFNKNNSFSMHELYTQLNERIKSALAEKTKVSKGEWTPYQCDQSITPRKFLDSLVPMVWSIETPIAALDAIYSWHYVSMCAKNNLSPLFDTGFSEEFFDYSNFVNSNSLHNGQFPFFQKVKLGCERIFTKINSFIFPQVAIRLLRKKLEHDPRLDFFRSQALLTEEQLRHAAPHFGKYFHVDFFIHEFYNAQKISSPIASLFYLNFKTKTIDSIGDERAHICLNHGIDYYSPYLDIEVLEFLASLDIESSKNLNSFPNTLCPIPLQNPKDAKAWIQDPEVTKIFDALISGYLVKSGFISEKWIKRLVHYKENMPFEVLYAILILELWMRLFIDRPISKTGYDTPIFELLL